MFGKKNHRNSMDDDDPIPDFLTKPRSDPNMAPPPPRTTAQRLSEQAAAAAQHVLDLEQQVEYFRVELGKFQNKNHLLELKLTEMEIELKTAIEQKQYYRDQNLQTAAKIDSIIKMVLDLAETHSNKPPISEEQQTLNEQRLSEALDEQSYREHHQEGVSPAA